MKLILCGDVVPTDISAPALERGDVRAAFGGMADEFASADAVVINLECALTDSDAAIRKCGPNLKGKPVCAQTLHKAGITHAGLSNNHVCDFGVDGLHDTQRALEDAGITWFGAGENDRDSRKPLEFECGGVRVGVCAVCEHEYSYALPNLPGSNPFDPFITPGDVRALKSRCDLVVVMYHGGKEQCEYPSPRLRGACRALAEAGADIVLTQHSHCIGCREEYAGAEIVYGEGNFSFVWHDENTQWHGGLALSVEIEDGKRTLRYIPVVTTDTGIEVASHDKAREMLDGFDTRSDIIRDEAACEREWRAFCETLREQYTSAAKALNSGDERGRQMFSHYLDCEAHLDVWHTLFETWHRTDNVK